jgi:phosphopantetheinyl transferase (holo-ACP synthase)
MPEHYKELINLNTHIAVWKISESEIDLAKGLELSKEALARFSQRRSTGNRKEYLAVRQLLKIYNIDPLIHQYDKNGAPYLTDGRYLSISHTKDVAAIAISSQPVGIDLELYQEKIIRIAPRFLHLKESLDLNKNKNIHYLSQIWTAKEALYKAFRKPGLNFRKQILIDPLEVNSKEGIGAIIFRNSVKKYKLYFRYFDGFCLSLATNKK